MAGVAGQREHESSGVAGGMPQPAAAVAVWCRWGNMRPHADALLHAVYGAGSHAQQEAGAAAPTTLRHLVVDAGDPRFIAGLPPLHPAAACCPACPPVDGVVHRASVAAAAASAGASAPQGGDGGVPSRTADSGVAANSAVDAPEGRRAGPPSFAANPSTGIGSGVCTAACHFRRGCFADLAQRCRELHGAMPAVEPDVDVVRVKLPSEFSASRDEHVHIGALDAASVAGNAIGAEIAEFSLRHKVRLLFMAAARDPWTERSDAAVRARLARDAPWLTVTVQSDTGCGGWLSPPPAAAAAAEAATATGAPPGGALNALHAHAHAHAQPNAQPHLPDGLARFSEFARRLRVSPQACADAARGTPAASPTAHAGTAGRHAQADECTASRGRIPCRWPYDWRAYVLLPSEAKVDATAATAVAWSAALRAAGTPVTDEHAVLVEAAAHTYVCAVQLQVRDAQRAADGVGGGARTGGVAVLDNESGGDRARDKRRAFYVRLAQAAPIIQSLVAAGAVCARGMWHAAVHACRGARATLHVAATSNENEGSAGSLGGWGAAAERACAASIHIQNGDTVDSSTRADEAHAYGLEFLATFCSRVLRYLTLREYHCHLLTVLPSLALQPGHAALSVLPWCAPPPARRARPHHHAGTAAEASAAEKISRDYFAASGASSSVLARLTSGAMGYPLVDAAAVFLRAKGTLPLPLWSLVSNVWCKHAGSPWWAGVAWSTGLMTAADVPMAIMRWQWCVGLVSAPTCTWARPPDPLDELCGVDAVFGASVDAIKVAARHHPAFAPHPHTTAHPWADEFAQQLDEGGAFVQTVLGARSLAADCFAPHRHGAVSLSSTLPAAWIHRPFDAPPAVLAAAGQQLAPEITDGKQPDGGAIYPLPVTSLAAVRAAVVAAVVAAQRHHADASQTEKRGATQSVAAAPAPAAAAAAAAATLACLDAEYAACEAVRDRLSAQVSANYDRAWGVVAGWPVLTEDDAALLTAQMGVRREDGWEQVVDDGDRHLRVFMQSRPDVAVKTVLATAVMPRHAAAEVFAALYELEKHRSWDLTWQQVDKLPRAAGELDAFNHVYYFIADSPPPPYSYVITQRDFVMFRGVAVDAATGAAMIFFRNGAHAGSPPVSTYIRGETLGVVGFGVTPLVSPAACRVARGLVLLPDGALALASGEPPAHLATLPAANQLFSPPAALARVSGSDTVCSVTLATAADPKGAIPAYLINFVAKRTPRMWVDRLSQACDKFRSQKH